MAPSVTTDRPKRPFWGNWKSPLQRKGTLTSLASENSHTVVLHPDTGQLRVEGCIVEPEPGIFGVLRLDGVEVLVEYLTKLPCTPASSRGDTLPEVLYVRPAPDVSNLKEGMSFTIFVNNAHFLVKVEQVLKPTARRVDVVPGYGERTAGIMDAEPSTSTPAVRFMETPLRRFHHLATPESTAPDTQRHPFTPVTPSPLGRLAPLMHTPASLEHKPLPSLPTPPLLGVAPGSATLRNIQNTDGEFRSPEETEMAEERASFVTPSVYNEYSPSILVVEPTAGPASRRNNPGSKSGSHRSRLELKEKSSKRASISHQPAITVSLPASAPGSPISTRTPSLRRMQRNRLSGDITNKDSEGNAPVQSTPDHNPWADDAGYPALLGSPMAPREGASHQEVSRWSYSLSGKTSSRHSRHSIQEYLQQEDELLILRAPTPQQVQEEIHLHTQYYPTPKTCGHSSRSRPRPVLQMPYAGCPMGTSELPSPEQPAAPPPRRRTLSKQDPLIEPAKRRDVMADTDYPGLGPIGGGRLGQNAPVQRQEFLNPTAPFPEAFLPRNLPDMRPQFQGDLTAVEGARRKGRGRTSSKDMATTPSSAMPFTARNINVPVEPQNGAGSSKNVHGTVPIPPFPMDAPQDARTSYCGCGAVFVSHEQARSIVEVACHQPQNTQYPLPPGMQRPQIHIRI